MESIWKQKSAVDVWKISYVSGIFLLNEKGSYLLIVQYSSNVHIVNMECFTCYSVSAWQENCMKNSIKFHKNNILQQEKTWIWQYGANVWNCSHNQCLYSGDLNWCIEEKCRSSLEFCGSDGGVFSMFPLFEQLLSGAGAGCGGRD